VPLQWPPEHSSSGSVPDAIAPHWPLNPPPRFATEHARQVSAHGAPQQYPSAQFPDKQSLVALHVAPLYFLQPPEPSQEPTAHSLSGSPYSAIGPHVPSTPLPFFDAVHA